MSPINELMELTDHEAETAAGACTLVGVAYIDSNADGSIDEVWLFYSC